ESLIVDSVDAQRALPHHADIVVEFAGAVGAGPGAQLATDAKIGIDQDDAILGALLGCAGGPDSYAGGSRERQARPRKRNGQPPRALADLKTMYRIEQY